MIFIKSLLTGFSNDRFKPLYANMNERDKVRECYSRLKLMIQTHLHVGFLTKSFMKGVSLKLFYWYIKLWQSSTIFKQRNNHEKFCD